MKTHELRELFLKFFEGHRHTRVASSPLVPGNDPTLLFTNAGMVQFKDVFLGREKRPYHRAASSQKCVRAGGKHNDLENVGYTARHHTFFEMLGNFSFGDYFKKEAIEFAWEFVTGRKWLGIDPKRLLVTVYHTDDQAHEVWAKTIRVPKDRIVRIGDKGAQYASDNFWQMGETGPCGPCSEIFYDHGEGIPGGAPGSKEPEGDRWVEIWNLVFMQFDRAADGSLTPLPAPSVDTGAGLERMAAVMQGVHDNYDTDQFKGLVSAARKLAAKPDHGNSLRVVADHIRATAFLLADGVTPSNEGRGYVLRRILRRALRHGWKLGRVGDFFWKMVGPLAQEMGEAYPELRTERGRIESAIREEEQRFGETLDKGMALLEEAMAQAKDRVISGSAVFRLYDTFGFPVDLTADIARERGLTLDQAGYEAEMARQRDRGRAASGFKAAYSAGAGIDARSEFTGYVRAHDTARVVALLRDGQAVKAISAGEDAVVVLDRTPFYAEAGGQVGDTGALSFVDPELTAAPAAGDDAPVPRDQRGRRVPSAHRGGPEAVFRVRDTQNLSADARGHIGRLESGILEVGDSVRADIDEPRRRAVMRNHSATHLLHAALRRHLGTGVVQKGSLVAPDRLRFDFSHPRPLAAEELAQIELAVNLEILGNEEARVETCGYDEALRKGAIALFGEKYGDRVRVLSFGDFSTELCGGTHVARTGDIGLFKIVSEGGVAAGIRRIEAVTGEGSLAYLREMEKRMGAVTEQLRIGRDEVPEKVRQLVERNRLLEKELADARVKLASGGAGGDLSAQVREVAGVKVLAAAVDGLDPAGLRTMLDGLKQRLGSGVIVLGSATGADKVALIAGVTPDLTAKLKAGDLVNAVAQRVGGKGGGRPDMAQAGGTQPGKLAEALAGVEDWVRGKLG